jgi:hypothetical protein
MTRCIRSLPPSRSWFRSQGNKVATLRSALGSLAIPANHHPDEKRYQNGFDRRLARPARQTIEWFSRLSPGFDGASYGTTRCPSGTNPALICWLTKLWLAD